jgi:uncharacterized membrane protein YesL
MSGMAVKRTGWEGRLLGALVHPMNIAAAGLAAAVLSLGVVTAVPAVIAAGRSMRRWLAGEDDAVFTGVFREFAASWRRSLPLGVGAVAVVAMLVVDVAFLTAQLEQGSAIAIALLAATVPVALALGLLLLALPASAALQPDASARAWLVGAGALVARRPFTALLLLLGVATFALLCYLFPTLLPFLGLSLPAYLALLVWGRPAATPGPGTRRGHHGDDRR